MKCKNVRLAALFLILLFVSGCASTGATALDGIVSNLSTIGSGAAGKATSGDAKVKQAASRDKTQGTLVGAGLGALVGRRVLGGVLGEKQAMAVGAAAGGAAGYQVGKHYAGIRQKTWNTQKVLNRQITDTNTSITHLNKMKVERTQTIKLLDGKIAALRRSNANAAQIRSTQQEKSNVAKAGLQAVQQEERKVSASLQKAIQSAEQEKGALNKQMQTVKQEQNKLRQLIQRAKQQRNQQQVTVLSRKQQVLSSKVQQITYKTVKLNDSVSRTKTHHKKYQQGIDNNKALYRHLIKSHMS